eukprot:3719912-Pyramimonas_sp.AAC.1
MPEDRRKVTLSCRAFLLLVEACAGPAQRRPARRRRAWRALPVRVPRRHATTASIPPALVFAPS